MPYFQHKEIVVSEPSPRLRDLLVKCVSSQGRYGGITSQREAKRIIGQGGVKIDDIGTITNSEFVLDFSERDTYRVRIGRYRVYDFKKGQ